MLYCFGKCRLDKLTLHCRPDGLLPLLSLFLGEIPWEVPLSSFQPAPIDFSMRFCRRSVLSRKPASKYFYWVHGSEELRKLLYSESNHLVHLSQSCLHGPTAALQSFQMVDITSLSGLNLGPSVFQADGLPLSCDPSPVAQIYLPSTPEPLSNSPGIKWCVILPSHPNRAG